MAAAEREARSFASDIPDDGWPRVAASVACRDRVSKASLKLPLEVLRTEVEDQGQVATATVSILSRGRRAHPTY